MLLALFACFSTPTPAPPVVVPPTVPPICYIDATHTLKVFMSSGPVATGSFTADGHTVNLTGTRAGRDLNFGDLKVSLRGRIATINPGFNPVQLVRAGCQ